MPTISAFHVVLAATLVSSSLLTAQQPPAAPPAGAAAPAPASATPSAAARSSGGSRGITTSVIEKNFPSLDAKANGQIRLLWISCGTADSLIGVNRQFKDWLKAKNVRFTEEEAADIGHVWPLWRQNLTDFAQKAFQPKAR